MKRSLVIVILISLIFVINSVSVLGAPLIFDDGGGANSGNIAPTIVVDTSDRYLEYKQSYYDPFCQVVDNEEGLECIFDGHVNTYNLGTYYLDVYAEDSQGLKSDVETIKYVISDNTAPLISYNEYSQTHESGRNYISDIDCTAIDGFDGNVDCVVDSSYINPYLIGTQLIYLSATDSHGNNTTITLELDIVNTRVDNSVIPYYCYTDLVGPITPEAMENCIQINSSDIYLDNQVGEMGELNSEEYINVSSGDVFPSTYYLDPNVSNIYHWEYQHDVSNYICGASSTNTLGVNQCYYELDAYYVNADYAKAYMMEYFLEYIKGIDVGIWETINNTILGMSISSAFVLTMDTVIMLSTSALIVQEGLLHATAAIPFANFCYYSLRVFFGVQGLLEDLATYKEKIMILDLLEFLQGDTSGKYVGFYEFSSKEYTVPRDYSDVSFNPINGALYRCGFMAYDSNYIDISLDVDYFSGSYFDEVFWQLDTYYEYDYFGSVRLEQDELLNYLLQKEVVVQ